MNVNVYQFITFNITNLDEIKSLDYATIETINRINGKPIQQTKLSINIKKLNDNGYYKIPDNLCVN